MSCLMAYSHYQHLLITSNDFRYGTKHFALQDFPTTAATAQYDTQGTTVLLMMKCVYVCVSSQRGEKREGWEESE